MGCVSVDRDGRGPGTRRPDRDLVPDPSAAALRRATARSLASTVDDERARSGSPRRRCELLAPPRCRARPTRRARAARGATRGRQRLRRPRRRRGVIAATTAPEPTVGPRLLRPEELPARRCGQDGAQAEARKPSAPRRSEQPRREATMRGVGSSTGFLLAAGSAVGRRPLPPPRGRAPRARRPLLRRRLDGLARRGLARGRAAAAARPRRCSGRAALSGARRSSRAALREHAYLEGDFVLRSGRRSRYYLDKYRFETRPELLGPLGERSPQAVAEVEPGRRPARRARARRRRARRRGLARLAACRS